jgi:protein-S-isoprenylcysteine O-methyltransferase Ste14
MTMTQFLFAVVSGLYVLLAIPFEERSLMRTSDAYQRYRERVRWKLVPGLY